MYRGYCLEQAAAAYDIALIDTKPPTWQQHLVIDYEVADTRDPASVTAAGLALAERHAIAGVVTWDEYALVPTAALAARLGVPGSTVAAMPRPPPPRTASASRSSSSRPATPQASA